MIYLNSWEYAKIVSEINTLYSKYADRKVAVHYSFGVDNRPYVYTFKNYGFNEYEFISRRRLK